MKDIYGKWGNYIPIDIREQFLDDCLEQDKQINELKKIDLHQIYIDTYYKGNNKKINDVEWNTITRLGQALNRK